MDIDNELLKSIPYFSSLSAGEIDSIKRFVKESKVERGEIILYEGDPTESLYFVASGAVKVFKTSAEGKEQILHIVRPRESFNDVSIFDDEPNPASAQAMAPVTLYQIKKDDLKTLLQDYPQLALNTIKVLAGQVRRLVSLVEDLSFRHVVNRVAKILLENTDRGDSLAPKLTQQEMAAMAGSAREVIGRSLKTLEDEGMIRLDRHRIVITDKEGLQEKVESAF